MKTIIKSFPLFLLALMLVFATGCNTSRAVKGGAAGGAVGGVIGGAIGKNNGSGTKGAIIGSVIGGAAGAVIGDYMDKQAKEVEQIEGAEVARVETTTEDGETVTSGYTITFDSGVLFAFGKYSLTDASRIELQKMADVFKKYPDTNIKIDGHTDNVGSDNSNQRLSEQRAASVADYLTSLGIDRTRMTTEGFGETRPVETNDTDAGRQANRRVEVAITPTEQLQQKAEEGTLTVPE
ncbi:outer membrane protein OmpA-like peptidoglycan-associated protein [Lewinella aquimaris]|uniref:Outer membrane protein OmpA-like peptidoglycan-associated protein n=1 Tax=Neolewinella aquimaris TaxID=1835722 RepID=A0A840E703_9BACT|nr:OmpA family protein [Neolewinella aquimaris]MBB4080820.1 outer membrane protein OmpA-like peptidoglycan-associated protein [Neolewinella aquimaris]